MFLFSDNQISLESFVEDIGMLLNTGDVPNLFQPDEKVTILEKIQDVANKIVCCFALYSTTIPLA